MNEEFIQRAIALNGALGKKWLQEIPEIIKHYEREWEITCFPPFPLSYNYVAPATIKIGKKAVLKISFPNNGEFLSELGALKFFDGSGSIKIEKEDLENKVMLLEKAEPGMSVRDVAPDNKQVSIVAEVLTILHKPISSKIASGFPTIYDWGKAFDRYKTKYSKNDGPVPKWMFEKAENIFWEFPKDKKECVLLHGDLHSDNILSSQRGWLAIDPKGIIGEREFELGAYLRNPYYDYPRGSDYKKLETSRIIQFSEALSFDKERLRDWAFACAVISLIWFLEDENHFKEVYVQNAELINKIKF